MRPQPEWYQKLIRLPDIDVNIKTFGGHRQKAPYRWKAEKETHFAFEIMLIIEGVQQTVFDNETQHFTAGDLILIPPGVPHENSCVSPEGLDYYCMHFDIDDPYIQEQLLLYCPLILDPENTAYQQIHSILFAFVELLASPVMDVRQKLIVEKLLIELVICLLDYTDSQKQKLENSNNEAIILARQIASSIQQNFRSFTEAPREDNQALLSLEKVANSLGISESTMLKVFKKVYETTPKHYQNQLRYNEAKYLLHQPMLTISQIAEIVGYQNGSHFSRQFKKWSMLSPIGYRKLHRMQRELVE